MKSTSSGQKILGNPLKMPRYTTQSSHFQPMQWRRKLITGLGLSTLISAVSNSHLAAILIKF